MHLRFPPWALLAISIRVLSIPPPPVASKFAVTIRPMIIARYFRYSLCRKYLCRAVNREWCSPRFVVPHRERGQPYLDRLRVALRRSTPTTRSVRLRRGLRNPLGVSKRRRISLASKRPRKLTARWLLLGSVHCSYRVLSRLLARGLRIKTFREIPLNSSTMLLSRNGCWRLYRGKLTRGYVRRNVIWAMERWIKWREKEEEFESFLI